MAIRLLLGALAFGVIAAPAGAVVKITAVAGASNYNIDSGVAPSILGGLGGTGNICVEDSLNTCNGCLDAVTPQVCNRRRIYSALKLRITFTSDTATGRPFLARSSPASLVEAPELGSVTKGNAATVEVPWSSVCAKIDSSDSTCTMDSNVRLANDFVVGIDANNDQAFSTGDDSAAVNIALLDPDPDALGTFNEIDSCADNFALPSPLNGLCAFLAYPGDKKIYAEDLEGGGSFPTTNTGTIKYINFYYQKTDFTGFSPAALTPKSVEVELVGTDTYELVDKIIDGLDNLTEYYFRTSSADEAGNEMFFTSNDAIIDECSSLTPIHPFDGTGGGDLCPFAAYPDEVLGLLNKDLNCFIATAAFGSSLHPLVDDMRAFRNKFLNPYKVGRGFVNWYYSWSPRAAHWLKTHTWAKPVAQGMLVPIWLVTKAVMWWPLTILAFLGFVLIRRRRA